MAKVSSNTMADAASFHRATTGLAVHLNLDSSNAFYTDEVSGLLVQTIAASGDDYAVVTFDVGDDLSKVMKFSQLVLQNTDVVDGRNNDGFYTIYAVDNTAKTILIYHPNVIAQADVGVGNVIPHQGAWYIKALEDSTTFTSLVENGDYVGGNETMLEGLTLSKGDQEFGFFTEVVPSAGKVRVALIF